MSLCVVKIFVSLCFECVSTKLGVTENFVSSLYLLIQSSTLKKCIEHCLTALATLLHVNRKYIITEALPSASKAMRVGPMSAKY